MINCKVCKTPYSNKLRQWCPVCGATNPFFSKMIGFITFRRN